MWTIVLTLLVALLASDTALAAPTTVTFQVSNRDDDYKESSSGASTRLDSTHDLWVSADSQQAYRFRNVTIPKDAYILEARVQLYATTGLDGDMRGFTRGEASGNSHAWTGTNYEITNTTKTGASEPITDLLPWTANTHNDAASVERIVQEIVNRSDWSSGNALTIFLIATTWDGHRRTRTYDSDPTQAAKLVVRYAVAPACGAAALLEVTPTSGQEVLDLGWTGSGHHSNVSPSNAKLTLATDCHDASSPCTDCDLLEVVRNRDANSGAIDNRRCTHDSSIKCTSDLQCAGKSTGSTCRYFLGSPSPVTGSSPNFAAIVSCSTSYVSGAVDGNVDPTNGDLAVSIPLTTRVTPFVVLPSNANAATVDACPRCVGDSTPNNGVRSGFCSSGPRSGLTCDANGSGHPVFGQTSLDCPASTTGSTVSTSTLAGMTATDTRELDFASSPRCDTVSSLHCFCSVCNDPASTPCFSDTDCPSGTCGGKKCSGGFNNGAPCTAPSMCPSGSCIVPLDPEMKPNPCPDHECSAIGVNDGVCLMPTPEKYCVPTAPKRYKPCAQDSDCQAFGVCSEDANKLCNSTSGNCSGTCILDTCATVPRPCYPDSGEDHAEVTAIGVVTSTPTAGQWDAAIAQLSCGGKAPQRALNEGLGLPGLARLQLPLHLRTR